MVVEWDRLGEGEEGGCDDRVRQGRGAPTQPWSSIASPSPTNIQQILRKQNHLSVFDPNNGFKGTAHRDGRGSKISLN